MMDLNILWFILITVLFAGFFLLEGFDYGVELLAPLVGQDETERRLLLHTIAPVWDGNEVWMITAGGALFAAFPHVYATMFSAFYLALFLLLCALILRGAGLELRNRAEGQGWHAFWDWAICFGSAVPALLWGVAVTNLLAGLPINSRMLYIGRFIDLLTPYTLLGGITFLLIFTFHGAAFLTLRLDNSSLAMRLHDVGRNTGLAALLAFAAYGLTTIRQTDFLQHPLALVLFAATTILFLGGWVFHCRRKTHPAFLLSSLAIITATASLFAGLFPRLMVSSLQPEWSLNIYNAASSPYTLTIMTIAAACLVPVVLAYQAWTYWVFRHRLTEKDLGHY